MQENHKERELFYIGKTIDTFCPALDQLMEYERLPKISSADCVSLRAFGFCADGGAEEWFRPLIDTESAVRRLGEATGLPFAAVRPGKGSGRTELPEAFVFGPVKYGVAAPAVSDRYYRGGGRYLFARRREKYTRQNFLLLASPNFYGIGARQMPTKRFAQSLPAPVGAGRDCALPCFGCFFV